MGLLAIFAVFVASVCVVTFGAPLTPGNLIVIRSGEGTGPLIPSNQVFIHEIALNGTMIQSWSPGNGYCVMDNNPYRLSLAWSPDRSGISFVCFEYYVGASAPPKTAYKNIYRIEAKTGEIALFAQVVEMLDEVGPMSAITSGVDAWVSGHNLSSAAMAADPAFVAYTVKGRFGAPLVFTSVLTGNAGATANMQILNGQFYISYFYVFPYYVAKVEGGPNAMKSETPAPITSLFDPRNDVTPDEMTNAQPNKAFLYSETEIYGSAEMGNYGAFKVYKDIDDQWKMYYVATGGKTLGITATVIDGVRTVFASTYNDVWRITDTGTSLTKDPTPVWSQAYCIIHDVRVVEESCFDNLVTQDESDVDCGGSICPKCDDSFKCVSNSDCTSNYCNPDNVCSVPSCDDGYKNQDETGVDCGGDLCEPRCGAGQGCLSGADCTDNLCLDAKCVTPSCEDTVKNRNETDVDCGGLCPQCDLGKDCLSAADCASNYCNSANKCDATCSDGVKNQDETDVDCGGVCPACPSSPESDSSPSGTLSPSAGGRTPDGKPVVNGADRPVLISIALVIAVLVYFV